VVLAPTLKAAQAAAAGAGVEEALFSQALRAAQAEAAAVAAAAVAAHEAQVDQLQEPTVKLRLQQQQQQRDGVSWNDGQLPQLTEASVSQPPSVAVEAGAHATGSTNGAESSSSSSSNGSLHAASYGITSSSSDVHMSESRPHGSTSSIDGSSRSVTVRVPESLASELAKSNAAVPNGAAAGSSSSAGGGSHAQQRQCAEQQPQPHHWQEHQQQQQHASPAVAGAVFAEGMHYADAYAAFELQQSQKIAAASIEAASTAAAAAAGVQAGAGVYADDGDDLVSGCLAPWSGAFESDSLDETELCTDSEMLEAALLQQQKQQAHAEWLQQQQQQQWLMMSSYDSSSVSKQQQQQQAAGSPSGVSCTPQLHQTHGVVPAVFGGLSGDSMGRSSSSSATSLQVTQAAQPPSASPGVSVTSITAAALDQHIQQQQAAVEGASWPLHHQQQQRDGAQSLDLLPMPAQLQGHFILAGCASSFVQFARQLAASASPEAEPLTVVLLHPDHPGAMDLAGASTTAS
jgi:hypothetical protein